MADIFIKLEDGTITHIENATSPLDVNDLPPGNHTVYLSSLSTALEMSGAQALEGSGSAAGAGTAAGTGTIVAQGSGAASGAGDASGSGTLVTPGAIQGSGAADGAGAASGSGVTVAQGSGSADGVGAASGSGTLGSSVTLSSPTARQELPIMADIGVITDTAGTINYVIVPASDPAPSHTQIMAGQNNSGATPSGATGQAGSILADAPGAVSEWITDLHAGDIYAVYFAQADSNVVSAATIDLQTVQKLVVANGPGRSNLQGVGLSSASVDYPTGQLNFTAGAREYFVPTETWTYPPEESVVGGTATNTMSISAANENALKTDPRTAYYDFYYLNLSIFGQQIEDIWEGEVIYDRGQQAVLDLMTADPTVGFGWFHAITGSSYTQRTDYYIDLLFSTFVPYYLEDFLGPIRAAHPDRVPTDPILVWGTYIQAFLDTRANAAYFSAQLADYPNQRTFTAIADGSTGLTTFGESTEGDGGPGNPDLVHLDPPSQRIHGQRFADSLFVAAARDKLPPPTVTAGVEALNIARYDGGLPDPPTVTAGTEQITISRYDGP